MATVIRAEVSKKNKYWIDKHRHYELKHFCLQYPYWKDSIIDIYNSRHLSNIERTASSNLPGDPTGSLAIKKVSYEDRIKLIERVAMKTDGLLYSYILKAVTEGYSYTYLKTRLKIPCS